MSDASSQDLYYRHSGAFDPGGALYALVMGLLVGVPLAWLYAWFIRWDWWIVLNAFACFFFAAIIGESSEHFLISHKCRNAIVAGVVALAVAFASYYVSWAVWLHTIFRNVGIVEFLNPRLMLHGIQVANRDGTWSLKSVVVRGVPLWIFWTAEAALWLGLACYLATDEMLEATFCEGCETWAQEQKGVCVVAAGQAVDVEGLSNKIYNKFVKELQTDAAELKRRMERKDLAYLEHLGPMPPDAMAWYRLDLHTCPNCNMTNTLRVTQFRRKFEDKKVRTRTVETEVLRQLLLSSTEVETLRKLGSKVAAR